MTFNLYEWKLEISNGYIQYALIIDETIIGFIYPTGVPIYSDKFSIDGIRRIPGAWDEVSFETI